MSRTSREEALLNAFAALADTLVADYDVVELLQLLVDTCQNLLDVNAVGLLLADPATGALELLASTSEQSRIVETMQLAAEAGPCVACYREGLPVNVPDISTQAADWPDFAESAIEQGFHGVFAIPMRLRAATIGTMNLLRTQSGDLNQADLRVAQALANVATIGILHERSLRASDAVRQQLQEALNSRTVIEQAKGVIAYRNDVDMDEAFRLLRTHARSHQTSLVETARGVVERRITL
jgi:transcriptional regulator with GAF, ATPase, and Fis domain